MSLFLLIFFCILLQCGCGTDVEPKQLTISPDYAVAQDISEMVEKAEIIAIGTFQEYQFSYNAERDPKHHNEPSKNSYSETKVYSFSIEQLLKGDVREPSILVSIPFSKELTGLKDEQGNELRFRIPNTAHVQPTLFKKYILFLRKNERTGMYQAPFTPYMIEIKHDNKVVLQKPPSETVSTFRSTNYNYQIRVEGIHLKKDEISGKDLSALIHQINNEQNAE